MTAQRAVCSLLGKGGLPMRIWCVAVLVCLAGPALGANGKPARLTIDGAKVVASQRFVANHQINFAAPTVYDAKLSDGRRCTIVAGTLISNVPSKDIEVVVDFEVHLMREGSMRAVSGCNVKGVIPKPLFGKVTKFVLVGPPFRKDDRTLSAKYMVLVKPKYGCREYQVHGALKADEFKIDH